MNMGNIIDGKALSALVKDEVRSEVQELEVRFGRKPCLCVITRSSLWTTWHI